MLETKPGNAVSIIECDMQVIEIEKRTDLSNALPSSQDFHQPRGSLYWTNRGFDQLMIKI